MVQSPHIVESLCFVAERNQNSEAAHQLRNSTWAGLQGLRQRVWPLLWNRVSCSVVGGGKLAPNFTKNWGLYMALPG